MAKKVKITSKRQITIPIDVFNELGLEVGQYLSIREEDGDLRLTPELNQGTSSASVLQKLIGAVDSPGGPSARQHDSILAHEARN